MAAHDAALPTWRVLSGLELSWSGGCNFPGLLQKRRDLASDAVDVKRRASACDEPRGEQRATPSLHRQKKPDGPPSTSRVSTAASSSPASHPQSSSLRPHHPSSRPGHPPPCCSIHAHPRTSLGALAPTTPAAGFHPPELLRYLAARSLQTAPSRVVSRSSSQTSNRLALIPGPSEPPVFPCSGSSEAPSSSAQLSSSPGVRAIRMCSCPLCSTAPSLPLHISAHRCCCPGI